MKYLFFLLFVFSLSSCFRQFGYVTDSQLIRLGEKLAYKEKRYYLIKSNGDTVESNAKETKYLNYKLPGDIVEYQGKYEHAKYYDNKWILLAKKGRINLFFSLVPNGSRRQAGVDSRTGRTYYTTVTTHDFYFYFQKNDGTIINILKNMGEFKESISDNVKCVKIFNSIEYRNKEEIKANQYQKLLDIIDVYNR